jgi:SseB protein N-terminal domain
MTAGMTESAARDAILEAVAALAEGTGGADALHDAFLAATFYCEAGDRPGFQAVNSPDGPAVPVFTSLGQLALARGAVAWFSTTGVDILDLLPPGLDLIVDGAGPHPVRLHPAALARRVRVDRGPEVRS